MFLMMNTERTATKNIETKKPRDYSKRRKKLYKFFITNISKPYVIIYFSFSLSDVAIPFCQ